MVCCSSCVGTAMLASCTSDALMLLSAEATVLDVAPSGVGCTGLLNIARWADCCGLLTAGMAGTSGVTEECVAADEWVGCAAGISMGATGNGAIAAEAV